MLKNLDVNDLKKETFIQTKTGIQKLGGIITKIKSRFSFPDKNSEQHSLKFSANGITTTPIPILYDNKVKSLELVINMEKNVLQIIFEDKEFTVEFENKDTNSIIDNLNKIFEEISILDKLGNLQVDENHRLSTNIEDLRSLWKILKMIYFHFLKFKSPILKETSNVNFWPHHFDIAMLLFSGRIISGQDPSNWSFSREQMNFGFLFGDELIPVPYFYVTIYPFDKMIIRKELSNGAYWYTKEWSGAVLEMQKEHFVNPDNTIIIDFFDEVRNLAPKQFYNP